MDDTPPCKNAALASRKSTYKGEPTSPRSLTSKRNQSSAADTCGNEVGQVDAHTSPRNHSDDSKVGAVGGKEQKHVPQIDISEKPVSKDYRSFAATTFGTVAFKMLEWLTPQGLESISEKVAEASEAATSTKTLEPNKSGNFDKSQLPASHEKPTVSGRQGSSVEAVPSHNTSTTDQSRGNINDATNSAEEATVARPHARRKRSSKGSVNATATSKPPKKGSFEPLPAPAPTDLAKPVTKPNGFHGDKRPKPAKLHSNVIGRSLPEIPLKPAFFENVPYPSPPSIRDVEVESTIDHAEPEVESTLKKPSSVVRKTELQSHTHQRLEASLTLNDSSLINYPLPQALSRLNVQLVEFICDTYAEDHTSEDQFFGPLTLSESSPRPQNAPRKLSRGRKHSATTTVSRSQWKNFNDQTIFNVLSDPHALVQSFTKDGKLYDSQTLWYCMLRMTRAAPSVVLHSLWLVAKNLFVPPQSLKAAGPTKKLFANNRATSLSNFEAGCLLSVCLHALVATAPCAQDSKTLYEMSRVRSNGLVLAGHGAAARQPSSMCLEYDDVFANELAMRLARRLFCAITARQSFANIVACNAKVENTARDIDVLALLLDQLDLIGSGPIRILEFPQAERLLHETRVPTLLLDWARAVLLQEWDGRPEYSNDSPFHGAMSLIATLCE